MQEIEVQGEVMKSPAPHLKDDDGDVATLSQQYDAYVVWDLKRLRCTSRGKWNNLEITVDGIKIGVETIIPMYSTWLTH